MLALETVQVNMAAPEEPVRGAGVAGRTAPGEEPCHALRGVARFRVPLSVPPPGERAVCQCRRRQRDTSLRKSCSPHRQG